MTTPDIDGDLGHCDAGQGSHHGSTSPQPEVLLLLCLTQPGTVISLLTARILLQRQRYSYLFIF
ncbi:hypothetical protein E2C01_101366 [Portunus trituberculatus]|uniref:Uncharacterized protein n=1 Tax=Portunus trituberculatus TaxID=210409 RepID=A0A5B7KLT7_PORTR|nr:hypothetical protein [Portunus trituberculatus]